MRHRVLRNAKWIHVAKQIASNLHSKRPSTMDLDMFCFGVKQKLLLVTTLSLLSTWPIDQYHLSATS